MIIFWLNRYMGKRQDITNYLIKELNLTKEALTEIISYKYPKPDDLSPFVEGHVKLLYMKK